MNTNTIAFVSLCSEYCQALEGVSSTTRGQFVASMTRLLPRLYIAATDLTTDSVDADEGYINPSLDEEYYESIRRNIETIMAQDDTYLEVFEADMKYSDTPIGASIAESLADIFQPLYNFLAMIDNAPDDIVDMAVGAIRDDFMAYWGQTLCNVMRPLNHLSMSTDSDSDSEFM